MAKYIGTYTNETAIQTALNNNELNRPFVALANDTKQVYYGPYLDLAQIGDIVVYDTARTSLRFIHLADYNTTTYPMATYEPIGIVCENQTATLAGGTSDVKMLSKNWMDMNNPDTGNHNYVSRMAWGVNNDNVIPNNIDGKVNTTFVLTYATGQPDWRTDSIINEGEGTYQLFECVWRYHTNGTSQGDWYVGSKEELTPMLTETNGPIINSAFTAIGASSFYYNSQSSIASSTASDKMNAFYFRTGSWQTSQRGWSTLNWNTRALYKGTILPM